MALEESIVLRQLDAKGRFGRFEFEDLVPVLLSYSLTWLFGVLGLNASAGYPFVAMASVALGVYLLRTRFPDGLGGLVRFVVQPKHLTPLGRDVVLRTPYPGAPSAQPGGAP